MIGWHQILVDRQGKPLYNVISKSFPSCFSDNEKMIISCCATHVLLKALEEITHHNEITYENDIELH